MPVQYDDIQVGDLMPAYTSLPITRTHLVRYACASGDFNPIHYDETFAHGIGLNSVIAHGMFIMGIAGEAITAWIGRKQIRKIRVKFLEMTQPVDLHNYENTKDRATITITGKVVSKYEEHGEKRIRCDIVARDKSGSRKLSGFFIAALP